MTMLPPERSAELQRLQWQALVVGVVAWIVCIVGAVFSPTQFFRAYLTAYLFYLGIAHGCFAILMIYYLTGGAWGYLSRRVMEAGMRTLPLLAVLFVPVACGVGNLYLWAQPEAVAASKELQHKQLYLNPPFFWGRAALYFILWVGTAYLLSLWSRREAETGDPRYLRRLETLSGPGLIVYGVTITFAAVDWIMSLTPAYRSTIIGPVFASGELLSGQAFVLLVLAWLVWRPPLANAISLEALNDLGNLLFTFLVIWAYTSYFQFMLIWIANLPYDIIWYLARGRDGWQWVGAALAALEFAVPFFLLLSRDVKRRPRALAWVAGLLLFMHLVFQYWQVMPSFPGTTIGQHWMDFVTPLAVGGPWLACFLWQLGRYPVLPPPGEDRDMALHLRHLDREQLAIEQGVHHAG
jgi:hypothetical protein